MSPLALSRRSTLWNVERFSYIHFNTTLISNQGFLKILVWVSHPCLHAVCICFPFFDSLLPFFCRAFTVTAIAQMCVLGLMWVFGAFLFDKKNIVAAYIFTALNSLQGALIFIMHCLLSRQVRYNICLHEADIEALLCVIQKKKLAMTWGLPVVIFFMMLWCPLQVREEYVHFFSCICKPQKRYSDFSSTNPSSSQSQVRILRPLPLSVSHKYTLVHIHCLTFKMSCFFSSRVLGVDSKLENHKYEYICLISNPKEYI